MRATHLRRLDLSPLILPLLLALTFFTRYISPSFLAELHPQPDVVEYVMGARNILEQGKFEIAINGQELPSRYSFGFPLLIIPTYLVFGVNYVNAIYAELSFDLLLVALVYWLGGRLFNRMAGLFAAAIVLFSPLDAYNAREYIMSDLPNTVFLIAAVIPLTYLRPYKSEGSSHRYLAYAALTGALLGFACWIRQIDIFYLPAFTLCVVIAVWYGAVDRRKMLRRILELCAVMLGAFTIMMLPLLSYNWMTFGGITRTGYNLYFPELYDDLGTVFASRNGFGLHAHAFHYLRALLGLPETALRLEEVPLYSPFIALMALGSTIRVFWQRASGRAGARTEPAGAMDEPDRSWSPHFRFAILAIALILVAFLTFTFYRSRVDVRFVHLFLPLVAVLAGGEIDRLVEGAVSLIRKNRWFSGKRATVVVWAALIVVFVGSCQLIEPISQSQIWRGELLVHRIRAAPSVVYMDMVNRCTPPDAIVVGDAVSPVLFSAYEPGDSRRKIWALDTAACCSFNNSVVPSFKASPELFEQALEEGKPLYFIGNPMGLAQLPEASAHYELEPTCAQPGWKGGPQLVLYRLLLRGNKNSAGTSE